MWWESRALGGIQWRPTSISEAELDLSGAQLMGLAGQSFAEAPGVLREEAENLLI